MNKHSLISIYFPLFFAKLIFVSYVLIVGYCFFSLPLGIFLSSKCLSILDLGPKFHERLKSFSRFLESPISKYLLTILAKSASCFWCFLKAFHQSFHSCWSHHSPVKVKVSGIVLSQRYQWNSIIFLTFYLSEACR